MGVLEPVEEAFEEEVPATPPGVRDLGAEDNSEDDLFAEEKEVKKPAVFTYNHDLSFKNILPVLPSKGDFEDILGARDFWTSQKATTKKSKYCAGCFEHVKKDLKTLSNVVENYKSEWDAIKDENAALKKEVEELKKLLNQKKEIEKGDVKVSISNSKEGSVDVLVRSMNFENTRSIFSNVEPSKRNVPDSADKYGINSFSISLPKQNVRPSAQTTELTTENKSKKTVAELRREFFAKEYQSEQKTFTARNFLEIKPEEKKETVKSKLTIRIKPKQKITEIISKLTSKINGSKVIPEAPQISMFQRFEKTKVEWQSDLGKTVFV